MWTTIVGILSALDGVSLGAMLSAFFHHEDWVKDQEKLEYRQLLDQLYETVSVVTRCRPNLNSPHDPGPLNQAVQALARVFEDRMFIAQQLRDSGAHDDWLTLKRIIYYDSGLSPQTQADLRYSLSNLHQREDALRVKILQQAQKHLIRFKIWSRK